MDVEETEVLIVGAGLAGLRCAGVLTSAGREVRIWEAADDIGGRIRTDIVDGFLCDRGFQVLNPAYPELTHCVDLPALQLQPFGAGVAVRRERDSAILVHPLRQPARVPAMLASGAIRPAAVAALARWASAALRPARLTATRTTDITLAAALDNSGVRGELRRVIDRFLAGVVLDDTGSTSNAFTLLLLRMFALGVPALPADGMQALPRQLAAPLTSQICTDRRVTSIAKDGTGWLITAHDGAALRARQVVVAADTRATAQLLGAAETTTRGVVTDWWASDTAPTGPPMLWVDGRVAPPGPVINTAVISAAAPSYAPPGRHLIQASALIGPGRREPAESEMRRHAAGILGADAADWQPLIRHVVADALPAQSPPLAVRRPIRDASGVWTCGDHRDTASIQGALVSGRRTGTAVLQALRKVNPAGSGMPRGQNDTVSTTTTLFTARMVRTMDDAHPIATAVLVDGDRIVAVGGTDELRSAATTVDTTFAEAVILPGLIDQHLHPVLGATTLMTDVIAIEDWNLPGRTCRAAASEQQYRQRLRDAEGALADPDSWLFSWGYHRLWHGELDRSVLDSISSTRPIAVWQRSCHEWFLNSAAIAALDITAESMSGHGPASAMADVDVGHWWESGMNLLLPVLSPHFLTQDRIAAGLRQMVAYLHHNGVTAFNEPGIIWDLEPWDLYQDILGAADTPLLSTFLVDARSQADSGMDPADAVADAERQVARACTGKVRLLGKQVKLFADGAIISQLMQMRDPYLDDDGHPDLCHHGEWMMQPDTFRAFARVYWNAHWQLHIHVNGDAALDLVLDTIAACMAEHPRTDHRTVIVHFANSTEEQIDRIAELGAIVSANSYYPVGFADKYAAHGLGQERADAMVRSASVLRRGIPLSLHSDLPMGPADPLTLAWCAVNRITASGRVAGPDQRISVHDALRAVTIEAAYSWRMEDQLGSIAPGKRANFTVLAADPYETDPAQLNQIPVLGTVYDGQWFPAGDELSVRST